MKILFVGFYDPSAGSPTTARIHDFAQVLKRKKIEVFVLSPKKLWNRKRRWVETYDGIYVLRFPVVSTRKPPILGGIVNIISAFCGFLLLYALRKPEITISTLPAGEPPLGVYIASKLIGKPVIFDVRDLWEDYESRKAKSLATLWYTILKKTYNMVYNEGLFCVAVTPQIVNHLVERGIKRVYLLPHCVDTSLFKPRDKTQTRKALGLNQTDFIVVYAGFLRDYYRIDIVVRSCHKLVFEKGVKNLKLFIVGSGPQVGEYIRTAKELRLSDNVFFVGLKPREKVAEFLGCSDVGVIPYDDNPLWVYPLPTKFYEYCSCGLPVIASVLEEAILARYIKKWKVGLLVKPLSVDQMSQAIEFLYHHEEKAHEMGANGRKLALAHFDREKITSDFSKLFVTASCEQEVERAR